MGQLNRQAITLLRLHKRDTAAIRTRKPMAALDRALRLRRLSHALSAESEEVGASRFSFAALRQQRRNRPLSTKGLRLIRQLGIDLNASIPNFGFGLQLQAISMPLKSRTRSACSQP